MKLNEALPDWNALAGANTTPTRKRPIESFTIQLGFVDGLPPEDIEGEIEDLQSRIQEMIEDAIQDGTTAISGVRFS